nr:NADH dehydrogenase [ubiquinone] 1 beta subcomplex subunit 7 isoform X1 [Pelodiscus sinensis]|eukprot:XP_025044958.1 NADH dehydrogenase [ubiquinone] 1 beta subcomplex subunit 7 isoform X1 [Pelodiscus sinensis]
MGAHLARRYLGGEDVEPDPLRMPSFDPGLGFEQRKERVMIATQQQMNEAQLPLEQRDYCAHYLIKLLKCKRDSFPNFLACKHERHDWDYCEHLEYVAACSGAWLHPWATLISRPQSWGCSPRGSEAAWPCGEHKGDLAIIPALPLS